MSGKYDEAIKAYKDELPAPEPVNTSTSRRTSKRSSQVVKYSTTPQVDKARRPLAKSKSPEYKQLAAWVPKDLFFEVKGVMASRQMEKELSQVVEEALRTWVAANR